MEDPSLLPVIAVIVAMPAIIAVLLAIVGIIWLRPVDLGWRLLLYSFLGSILCGIAGTIIGFLQGYF